MAVDVVTFGCRLNAYESEVIRRKADAAGLDQLDGGAVIVNTCAVTAEAVRQARQAIRKARRENPNARIIVTGCAAQTEPGAPSARWRRWTSCWATRRSCRRIITERCPISA